MTGSCAASTVTTGFVGMPAMEQRDHDRRFVPGTIGAPEMTSNRGGGTTMTTETDPKLSRRGVFAASAGAAAGTALVAPPVIAQGTTVRRMQRHRPTGNCYWGDIFVTFRDRVTEATDGALHQALQTDVVDGAHRGATATDWAMNVQEVCDDIIEPDLVGHLNGEVMVGLEAWNALGDDLRAVVTDVTRAMSAEAAAHFLYRDILFKQEFVNDFGGELIQMEDDTLQALRTASREVVDEHAAQDPEYSGRLGEMLHAFLKTTGRA